MKSLQEFQEKRYEVRALGVFDGVERPVENPRQVILLLHGLQERGLRIYRKLINFLPDDALILAPNGPFPLPRLTNERIEYGHAWYFYDPKTQDYFINQKLAVSWLTELLAQKDIAQLPLTIIGFSQGGYLAPLVGENLPQTKLVIGLGCEFRENLVNPKMKFPLVGIHGENDFVVNVNHSRTEAQKLMSKGASVEWETVPDTTHEISEKMGERVKFYLEKYAANGL